MCCDSNFFFFIYDTPLEKLTIISQRTTISAILFGDRRTAFDGTSTQEKEIPLIKQAKTQLLEYFAGKRQTFALSIAPQGTLFQMQVWKTLLRIPYGATWSYKDIALAINKPKGFRAVARAIHKNPIPVIIPCHRVIGTNGSLTGFSGGISLKQKLLDLEYRSLQKNSELP
jgi:methylated-DNA-[protein]-cysteine S-methyltransferase